MAPLIDKTAVAGNTPQATSAADRSSRLVIMPLRAAEQHVLVVVGEADMQTAGQLRTQLINLLWAAPASSVVVELAALGFCDLSGLDALHDAARAAADVGVALTFRGMSPQLSWLHATYPPGDPTTPPPTPAKAETPTTGTPQTPAPADPGRSVPQYLAGRGGGRRGALDQLLHAVPPGDTTRSAICGARVRSPRQTWTPEDPASCPDCVKAMRPAAVATVHTFPTPQGAGAFSQPARTPTLSRRVS